MAKRLELLDEKIISETEEQLKKRYPSRKLDDPELSNFSNILCDGWPTVKKVLEIVARLVPGVEGSVKTVISVGEGAHRFLCR